MSGGSSRDRRKYRRLRDELAQDLSAKFSTDGHPPKHLELKGYSKTAKRVFSLLIACSSIIIAWAGIPAIVNNYRPQFTFAPQTSLNPDNIFATPFVLRNTGSFDATDLTVVCEPNLEGTGSSHISMRGIDFSGPKIPRLAAGGAGSTISCRSWFPVPAHLNLGERFTVKFSVTGRYGYSWLNWKIHKMYNYVGVGISDGSAAFQEQPADDANELHGTRLIDERH